MIEAAPQSTTYFAPPERLSSYDIARQVDEMDNLGALAPVLDSMPDAVMILNGQRQILFGNKIVRDYASAHDISDFQGLRPGELFECRQAAIAPSGCGTAEACRTCGTVNAILAGLNGRSACLECRVSSARNDALDLRICASPFGWQGRAFVLVVASDISNEKRRQILERIFFHDILNTAGNILGIAEAITVEGKNAAELIPLLQSSAESLIGEIDSQRTLLAAENRTLPVEFAPLSARAQLKSVVDRFTHDKVGNGKSIVIDPGTVDFRFVSDEAILHRVLGNLLKNALEASRAGETVAVGAALAAGKPAFWCHNPGSIPRAAQLQIFQRSFSTKGAGRGIGTHSVKLLTERYLGGRVSFTSSQAHGTRFEVVLPASPT